MKEKTIPFVFTYLQKTIEENPSGSGYLVGRKVCYYEIRINRGILIFVDFVVNLNHENKNPTKYNFSIDCCLKYFKPWIQEPMDHCIL